MRNKVAIEWLDAEANQCIREANKINADTQAHNDLKKAAKILARASCLLEDVAFVGEGEDHLGVLSEEIADGKL